MAGLLGRTFADDPGAVGMGGGGLLGPMTGAQKAALLFAGLRDAVGNFSGRPTENLNQLADQYGQMNYRQQVRQDRLSEKDAARQAEQDRREWELKNRDPKLQTGINPETNQMAQYYLDPMSRKPVWVDGVKLPGEAPKSRTIRMGMQDITQEFDPITGGWKQVAAGAAFRPESTKGPDAPAGYRWNTKGALEFIPGGPADPAKGAGKKAPTEDQAKNTQLYTLSTKMLPQVLSGFDDLASTANLAGKRLSDMTFGAVSDAAVTSSKYQQADAGLESIVANFIYSTSGAAAPKEEVVKRANTIRPKFGDSQDTINKKKAALLNMVDSIRVRAVPGTPQWTPPKDMGQSAAPAGTPPDIDATLKKYGL